MKLMIAFYLMLGITSIALVILIVEANLSMKTYTLVPSVFILDSRSPPTETQPRFHVIVPELESNDHHLKEGKKANITVNHKEDDTKDNTDVEKEINIWGLLFILSVCWIFGGVFFLYLILLCSGCVKPPTMTEEEAQPMTVEVDLELV